MVLVNLDRQQNVGYLLKMENGNPVSRRRRKNSVFNKYLRAKYIDTQMKRFFKDDMAKSSIKKKKKNQGVFFFGASVCGDEGKEIKVVFILRLLRLRLPSWGSTFSKQPTSDG